MNPMVKKAVIATLVMGTSMMGLAGVTFAGTTASTISAPPSVVVNGATWYQVSTAGQLDYIDQNQSSYLSANMELTNNVELTGYSWVPFGGNSYAAYSGTFNGQGYGVLNLNVNDTSDNYVGLFGESSGTIENLHVSGSLSGGNGSNVGGLVGYESGGSITDSWASGLVSAGSGAGLVSNAGGLVGVQNGSIKDSYATGSVLTGGLSNAGGLVGVQEGSIKDSWASGLVSAGNPSYAGGLVGDENGGANTDSYYDAVTTKQPQGVGLGSQNGVIGEFDRSDENGVYLYRMGLHEHVGD